MNNKLIYGHTEYAQGPANAEFSENSKENAVSDHPQEIPSQLDALFKLLNLQQTLLDILQDRLSPVMCDSSPNPATSPVTEAMSCAMSTLLEDLKARLTLANQRLEITLDRLCL